MFVGPVPTNGDVSITGFVIPRQMIQIIVRRSKNVRRKLVLGNCGAPPLINPAIMPRSKNVRIIPSATLIIALKPWESAPTKTGRCQWARAWGQNSGLSIHFAMEVRIVGKGKSVRPMVQLFVLI